MEVQYHYGGKFVKYKDMYILCMYISIEFYKPWKYVAFYKLCTRKTLKRPIFYQTIKHVHGFQLGPVIRLQGKYSFVIHYDYEMSSITWYSRNTTLFIKTILKFFTVRDGTVVYLEFSESLADGVQFQLSRSEADTVVNKK